MSDIQLIQSPSFRKSYKKLTASIRLKVDEAICAIMKDPTIGAKKKGDLASLYVYKFKATYQELLLGYEWDEQQHILIALGAHENFYRDLKRKV